MSALSKARSVTVRREDSRRLEDEARRMESKLEVLRRTLDSPSGYPPAADSGSRWKSGSSGKPITRGYVKGVLEAKAKAKPPGKPGKPQEATAREEVPAPGPAVGNVVGPGAAASSAAVAPGTQREEAAESGASGGTRAASNLQANLRKQGDEALEVEGFLAELKLDRYVGLFMEHGFDCMDVVKDMEDSHMRDIGMASGHIIKLRKKLTELAPPPGETQRRVTFGETVEAPEKPTPKTQDGSNTGSAGLSTGNFDEEESAASFQEALRAWREGREPTPGTPAKSSSGPAPQKTAATTAASGGSFWASVGGGEMDLSRASPTPRASAGTDTATEQHHPAPGEEKLCCFQCYRQFFARHAIERTAPGAPRAVRVCSEACASKWEEATRAKAEALQKRQEQLLKMQELQRAMAAGEEAGAAGAPAAA